MQNVNALLFDLGNVLLEVDPGRCFAHWAQFSVHTAEQLSKMPVLDTAFEKHEVGLLSDEQYFDYLRELMSLDASTAQIKAGWDAMLGEPILPTIEMVRQCRDKLPRSIFSNTNPSHQQKWSDAHADFLQLFDQIFVSSEIALRKPDLPAFAYVCEAMKIPAQNILFFDDREDNIAGARAAGLQTVLVNSHEDVAKALAELNLI